MKMTELQSILMQGAFLSGGCFPVEGEDSIHTATIDVGDPELRTTSKVWGERIEVHGDTFESASRMRDFILAAVNEKIASMTMGEWKNLAQ